jgi:phosphatidylinositol dimannoside acyltransferase
MMAASRDLRWFIAYRISRIGARLGPFLPTSVWYALAWPFAELCYLLMFKRRRTVRDNLARVVGDAEAPAATRRVFHNFARYVIDFYQLPRLSKDALRRRMDFEDWQRLGDAMAHSRGVLLVTLHLGQAELGAGALAAYGYQVNAVAETFPYTPMNEFIQGLRQDLGMKVIPAKKAKSGVLRCLHRGEALALMVDVVEPGDGVTVQFFGRPVVFSSAPARIALRTGSRILPGVVARSEVDPKRLVPIIDFDFVYEATGDEESDVMMLTQAMATRLEGHVRRFPDQWFAFRPAWQPTAPARGSGRWKVWALKGGMTTGGLLPKPAAYAIARLAGDFAYRFRHGARADVQDNMRHVLGPDATAESVEAAAREAFRNVARYYVDLMQLPRMALQRRIGRDVRLHGFDILQDAIAEGRGVVVSTAHFGNPEMGVQVGAVLGLDVLILAEPLQPPAFAETMRELRSVFKPRYEEVGFGAVANAIRHLRKGGVLAITCDRDIQKNGTPLPFFGAVTRMPLGAVELAQRTGAALVPGYCMRVGGGGFDIYFEPPLKLCSTGDTRLDAKTNARKLLERAEAWIASDPGQWMVLERIWKPVALPMAAQQPEQAVGQPT